MFSLKFNDFRFMIYHNGRELNLKRAYRLTETVFREKHVLSCPSIVTPERSLFVFICKSCRIALPELIKQIDFDAHLKQIIIYYRAADEIKACLPLT